jgi:quinoprotein glucose dehydrogenase
VWPIEERPVAQSDVPGEKTSPTQPFPTKPPAYARAWLKVPDDLIDFTPEMRAEAIERLKHYRVEGMFTPPVVGNPSKWLGGISMGNATGGTNWAGGGFDPETHTVYVQAANSFVSAVSLRKPPEGFSDIRYVAGREDQPFRVIEGPGFGSAADAPQLGRRGGGRGAAPAPATDGGAPAAGGGRGAAGAGGAATAAGGLLIQGLPIVKPPYGVLSAIDLDKGDLKWQVPYGETPDNIRLHPALKGKDIPNTGMNGYNGCGVLVTKTLVIIGDTQVTSVTHPRGAMMRAYDKATGKEVGAVWMPAPVSGSPMTYMWQGKQYIVIAVSGGNYSGEYLAYALPDAE